MRLHAGHCDVGTMFSGSLDLSAPDVFEVGQRIILSRGHWPMYVGDPSGHPLRSITLRRQGVISFVLIHMLYYVWLSNSRLFEVDRCIADSAGIRDAVGYGYVFQAPFASAVLPPILESRPVKFAVIRG